MRRWLVVFTALSLLLLTLLPACGGGGEEKNPTPTPFRTATVTPTATVAPTVTTTPTATPTGLVKVDAIGPWRGAMAMSGVLEWDSAWGPLRIAPDGIGEVTAMVAQVQEGGNMVKVWPQLVRAKRASLTSLGVLVMFGLAKKPETGLFKTEWPSI